MCVDKSIQNMLSTVIFVRTMDKRVQVEDLSLDSDVAFAQARATVAKSMVESLTGQRAQLKEDIEFGTNLVLKKESLGLDTKKDKEVLGDLIDSQLENLFEKYEKA